MSPKGTNNATCSLPVTLQNLMYGGIWGWNYRFHMYTQKWTKKHTHSLLSFDAKCQLPCTTDTILHAPLGFCCQLSARGGNRQHLSWTTRWRNVVHTAVGVIERSQTGCGNQNPFFLWNKRKKILSIPPDFIVCDVYTIQGKHLVVSQSNKTS